MHSSQMKWPYVAKLASNQARRHLDVMALSAKVAEELRELFEFHGDNHAAVAKQLFSNEEPESLAIVKDLANLIDVFEEQAPQAQHPVLRRWG